MKRVTPLLRAVAGLVTFLSVPLLVAGRSTAVGAATTVKSTTTTVPDDYLNLFPSGVPDNWSGDIPGTGSRGTVLPGAIVALVSGLTILGATRRTRQA